MTSRFTMDVGPDFDQRISELAAQQHTSKAEIIKRAVASYTYLKKETEAGNQVIITKPASGEPIKEVILP